MWTHVATLYHNPTREETKIPEWSFRDCMSYSKVPSTAPRCFSYEATQISSSPDKYQGCVSPQISI